MDELTSSQKGAIAEAEMAATAINLDLVVLRPLSDGRRYDLALDIGAQLLRVQCKWASRRGNVLSAYCSTCRHTPRGYIPTTYSCDEVDAIGIYSPITDRCYLIPISEVEGRSSISLRLAPTGNNQSHEVRWATDYELDRSIERNWR